MSELRITPSKIVAVAVPILGTLAIMFWGVPYYLKAEVHDLFMVESIASPHPVTTADLAGTTAAVIALQLQLTSMENRMIARDKLFMDYLKEQAIRGTNN